jgi:hypothetical protein
MTVALPSPAVILSLSKDQTRPANLSTGPSPQPTAPHPPVAAVYDRRTYQSLILSLSKHQLPADNQSNESSLILPSHDEKLN